MSPNTRTEVQMLIRKPVSEVFRAFIDPEITKNFWFSKGSGKLETGKLVKWEWEMYNVSVEIIVKELIVNEKIVYYWFGTPLNVEINFRTLSDGSTYVTIVEYGYQVTGDELITAIKDSTGGFTTVLDGLKAFLEHGINLNLITDKFPKEAAKPGK